MIAVERLVARKAIFWITPLGSSCGVCEQRPPSWPGYPVELGVSYVFQIFGVFWSYLVLAVDSSARNRPLLVVPLIVKSHERVFLRVRLIDRDMSQANLRGTIASRPKPPSNI